MTGIDLATLMVIGPDCICKCKSNYHNIAAMTPPAEIRYFCQKTPIPRYVVGLLISDMWNTLALCHLLFTPREYERSCICVLGVEYERSCTCLLGVESAVMYMCARGIV